MRLTLPPGPPISVKQTDAGPTMLDDLLDGIAGMFSRSRDRASDVERQTQSSVAAAVKAMDDLVVTLEAMRAEASDAMQEWVNVIYAASPSPDFDRAAAQQELAAWQGRAAVLGSLAAMVDATRQSMSGTMRGSA